MVKIFLSYAHSDGGTAAERLREELEYAEYEVWRDVENMRGGVDWQEQVTDVLHEVDTILLLLTPDAVQSESVTWEWTGALFLKKPLIPLLIERCDVPQRLTNVHYHNMTSPERYSLAYSALIRDLNRIAAGKALPSEPATSGKFGSKGIQVTQTATNSGQVTQIAHQEGDLHIGDTFNMSGDFRGALLNIKSKLDHVTQTINTLPKASPDDREQLNALIARLKDELGRAQPSQQEEAEAVTELVEDFIEAANKPQPNRVILKSKGQGLKDIAGTLVNALPAVLPIITEIVGHVLKLAGG
ncbi:MAG: toll/interleukin-1 receptor domain-containing protein [Anaerolineae bacterium]|nr:toll/interleukin-1 receptor domain-containing protein [Anaerolineae bacterium]